MNAGFCLAHRAHLKRACVVPLSVPGVRPLRPVRRGTSADGEEEEVDNSSPVCGEVPA